jgi:protein SCO1/2
LESTRQLRLTAGTDYDILVVSIRPEETAATARDRHHTYSTRYGRGEKGWHFLVQGRDPVRQLADAVGFRYAYDPETSQFAHPSGIVVLTPEGKVSRYFQGIEYRPLELQNALAEASHEQIGPIAQRLLLLCFHYDPTTGKYGLIITRVVQFAGIGTVLALAGMILVLKRRERLRVVAP